VKIQRTDEEQAAFTALFMALQDALRAARTGDDVVVIAESVEYHLLELGYVIVEVPPVNI
jgi:hypothetical protein